MASGKYDSGYSFDSDHSDTWKQRHGGGTPVTLTADEQKLAGAMPGRPQASARPEPEPRRPRSGQRDEAEKPDPRACPGECNKRYRAAWEKYQAEAEDYNQTGLLDSSRSRPEPPDEGFWHGEPVWCPECTSKITLHLAQLDTLASLLAAYADGHRPAVSMERVSGSAEPPSPSQAGDDLDDMYVMLSTWETIYRKLKGWPSGAPAGELASRETECISWLRRHLGGILASDVAADFGREVLQWHRESAGSAKAGVRTRRKPMRCPAPSCQNLTLFWTEGDKNVYCKNPDCGRILSLAEYEAEAERQAAILRRGGEEAEEIAS